MRSLCFLFIFANIALADLFAPNGSVATWNLDDNGLWNDSLHWNPTAVPNAEDATAEFFNIITAPRIIDLTGGFTVGVVHIDSGQAYSFVGGDLSVNRGILITNAFGNAAHSFTTPISFSADTVICQDSTETVAISSTSGAGRLTKQGPGNLSIFSANHSGGTFVLDGTLTLRGTFPSNNIVVQNATIASSQDLLNFGSGETITITNDATFSPVGGVIDIEGEITGTGRLVRSGSNTLTLSNPGANTYTGGTFLNAGRVNILAGAGKFGTNTIVINDAVVFSDEAGGTINIANPISLNGNLTIDSSATFQLTGSISGDMPLHITGGGTCIVSGNNLHTGGTSVANATLRLGANTALGTEQLQCSGASILSNSTSITIGNNISLVDTPSILAPSGTTFSITGNISGDGSLNKIGQGTLVLSGNNSYRGTTINSGTLVAASQTAFGAAEIEVAGTAVLSNNVSLILNNDITLTDTPSVDCLLATTFALSGTIDGSGCLHKIGAGTLVLTRANSYEGGTLINEGAVLLGSNSALGEETVDLTGNSILGNTSSITISNDIELLDTPSILVQNGTIFSITGDISGAGSLNKTGQGSLVLSGNNSYGVGTTVNEGKLITGSSQAFGTEEIDLFGDAILSNNASFTLNNAISVTGTPSIEVISGTTLTFSGIVDGTGSLDKTGEGTLALTGFNTYDRPTRINQGTVLVGSNSALSAAQVELKATSTLANSASVSVNNAIQLSNTPTIATQTGTTFALTGNISGTGSLNKTGNGTLLLSGDNSYSTGTTVNEGTLQVGSATALGLGQVDLFDNAVLSNNASFTLSNALSLTGNASVDTLPATTLTVSGLITGPGSLNKTGEGTLVVTRANSYSGTTVNQGTVLLGVNSALGEEEIILTGTSILGNNSSVIISNEIEISDTPTILSAEQTTFFIAGPISGTGSLHKIGQGTVLLSGNNSYIAGTTVNEGTLIIGSDTAIGIGRIDLLGSSVLSNNASFTLNNALSLTGNATIDVLSATTLGISGIINGAGSFNKTGGGTLALTQANSYAGSTFINEGTVLVGSNTAFSTGVVNLTGNAVLSNSTSVVVNNRMALANNPVINVPLGLSFGLAGELSGTGSLHKTGEGTLLLEEENTYSGGSVLTAGTVRISKSNSLGTNNVAINATAVLSVDSSLTIPNIFSIEGTPTISVPMDTNVTFTGLINGAGSLEKSGPGSLVLGTDNLYTGGTNVREGTLGISSENALGTSVVNLADTTTLESRATLTCTNRINIDNSGYISAPSGITFTLSGNIEGTGALHKQGEGTVLLSGTGSYTAGTRISEGTLSITNGAALGSQPIDMVNNCVLSNTHSLGLANAIEVTNTPSISTPVNTNFALSGIIRGDGSLQKLGEGTLTLTRNNTYSGGTTISNGRVQVANSSSLGIGAVALTETGILSPINSVILDNPISLSGTPVIDVFSGRDLQFSGQVTGSAILEKQGQGTLVLTNNNNTYSNGTNVLAGTLQVASDAALGTGNVSFATGTTLANSTSVTLANTFDILNNVILETANTTNMTVTGVISGAGSLQKTGAGTLTLTANNMYAGGTNLSQGTLAFTQAEAIPEATITAFSGTTLQANNTLSLPNDLQLNDNVMFSTPVGVVWTVSGTIQGDGFLNKIGEGTLIVAGNNTYNAGTIVNQGTLSVATAFALGREEIDLLNNAVLTNAASLGLANNIELTNSPIILASAGYNFTLSGRIQGEGSLTKTGEGTLILTGDNSYLGGSNINEGTLQIDSNTALGTQTAHVTGTSVVTNSVSVVLDNPFSFSNTPTIDVLTGTSMTFSGQLSGTGSFEKTGEGTLVLTKNNSYTAGTTISVGTIVAGNDAALGTGNVNLTATSVLSNMTSLTLPNTVALSSTPTIDVIAGTNLSFSAEIRGTGSLNKTGQGTLILDSNNNYSGGTLITEGSVQVARDTALGTEEVEITGPSILSNAISVMLANNFTLVNTPRFSTPQASNMTLTGAITGTGSLEKSGEGTLTLTGNNTYAGNTNVLQGALAFTQPEAIPATNITAANGTTLEALNTLALPNRITLENSVSFSTASGVNWTVSGKIEGAGSLNKIGQGTLLVSGDNTYAVGTTINEGTLSVGSNTALGAQEVDIVNNAVLTNTGSIALANDIELSNTPWILASTGENFTLSGTIRGTGSLQKTGEGTLILTGDNMYSGGTDILAGTVQIASNTAFGTQEVEFIGTSILSNSVSVALQNPFILAGTATLQVLTGTNMSFSGEFSGSGSLQKTGEGTVSLTNSNSYTGGTNVLEGTVELGSHLALGTGVVNLEGTATLSNSASVGLTNTVALVGTPRIDVLDNTTMLLSGALVGAGSLNKTGQGTLTLLNGNLYTGGTIVQQGRLELETNNSAGTGNIQLLGTSSLSNSTSLQVGNTFTLTDTPAFFTPNSTQLTLTGAITGAGSLQKSGSGTLILTANNAYAGQTELLAGTLAFTQENAIPPTLINAFNGTTLQANSTLSLPNNIELNNSITFSTPSAVTWTLSGQIGGAGSLNKTGAGSLIVSGNNNYSLGTTVNQGTLFVGSTTALGPQEIDLANNAVLSSTGSLALTNNIELTNSPCILVSSGDNFTLSGRIQGTGSLRKTGEGTLVLTRDNRYTGGTNILAGTVQIDSSRSLGTQVVEMTGNAILSNSVSIAVENGFILSETPSIGVLAGTSMTLSGVLGGSGSLEKIGDGTLVLTGNNLYTAGTNIFSGTVEVANNSSLGTGPVVFMGSSVLSNSASVNLPNTFSLLGTPVVNVASGTNLTFAQQLSGTGSLDKQGEGTLVLETTNLYTGHTNIREGTVVLRADDALGTNSINLFNATTLTSNLSLSISNSMTITGTPDFVVNDLQTLTITGNIGGTGALQKQGPGTLVLSGTNTYNSGTTLNEGTLVVSTSNALGNGELDIANQATLSNSTTLGIANAIELFGESRIFAMENTNFNLLGAIKGDGSLHKQGTGTLFLSGNNTYAGSTSIEQGTICVDSNTRLGSGDLLLNGGTWCTINTFTSTKNIAIPSLGTIDVQEGTLLNLTGQITGANLVKTGLGTLIFSGSSTYQNTFLQSGVIQVDAGFQATGSMTIEQAELQALANTTVEQLVLNTQATLNIADLSHTLTINQPISGNGDLVKTGLGNLSLQTANALEYTGDTFINQGAILLPSGRNALGNGSLVFGGGSLEAVNGGIYLLENPIILLENGFFQAQANTEYQLTGVISGEKPLDLQGEGSFLVTNNNSYSEGTFVGNNTTLITGLQESLGTGTVTLDTNSTLRITDTAEFTQDIVSSNANIEVNEGVVATVSGRVDGTNLVKTGAGELAFNNVNPIVGSIDVMEGTVCLCKDARLPNATINVNENGSLNGDGFFGAIVFNGIRLQGNGFYDALNMNKGTAAPGNSIGTLTVAGNYVQNTNAVYELELDSFASDQILVTGSATIANGAILDVVPIGSLFRGTSYDILIADGGIDNLWTIVQNDDSIPFVLTLEEGSTIARLQLLENAFFENKNLDPGIPAEIDNYLEDLNLDESCDLKEVIAAIDQLNEKQVNRALTAVSPALYASLEWENLDTNRQIIHVLQKQLRKPSCQKRSCSSENSKNRFFIAPFGLLSDIQGFSGLLGYNTGTLGFLMGYAKPVNEQLLWGVNCGYAFSDIGWKRSFGRGKVHKVTSGFYTAYNHGVFLFDFTLLGGLNVYNTKRYIEFLAEDIETVTANAPLRFQRHALSDYVGGFLQPQFSSKCTIYQGKTSAINLVSALNYVYFHQPEHIEKQAQSLNLEVFARHSHTLCSEIGVHCNKEVLVGNLCHRFSGSLRWLHKKPLTKGEYRAKLLDFSDEEEMLTIDTFDHSKSFFAPGVEWVISQGSFSGSFVYEAEYASQYFVQGVTASFACCF